MLFRCIFEMYSINLLPVGLRTEHETENSAFRSIKLNEGLSIITLRILMLAVFTAWLLGVLG